MVTSTAEVEQSLSFCLSRVAGSGEVHAVPCLSRSKLAQHGFKLPNLRVRFEDVPDATTVHREKQFEFAVVTHRGSDFERTCAQGLE